MLLFRSIFLSICIIICRTEVRPSVCFYIKFPVTKLNDKIKLLSMQCVPLRNELFRPDLFIKQSCKHVHFCYQKMGFLNGCACEFSCFWSQPLVDTQGTAVNVLEHRLNFNRLNLLRCWHFGCQLLVFWCQNVRYFYRMIKPPQTHARV